MNNYDLNGKFLRVCLQQSDKQFDANANLLVRNLAQEVTQKEFHEFFKSLGNVRSTKIETFSDGKSRSFGYVLFETAEMA